MVARRLWIALQQVIRSVLIILFPLAFITLFAWATAGSTYGTTSDPMRAAVWLWLGAHLAPFNITSNEITGYLSFLPIGAAVLPWLSMRVGYRRVNAVIGNKKVSRSYFILAYLIVYLTLALIASNSQASVDFFRALVILFILLIFATADIRLENTIKLPVQIFLIALGIAGLFLTLSLLLNFSIIKNLTVVLSPGILGGFLLLLLQILYLPNILFMSLSYILGSGFALGYATQISPLVFNLREIPAIPILAALPSNRNVWLVIPTLIITAYAWLNLLLINKISLDKKSKQQLIIRFFVISILGIMLISFVTSGSLISSNMSPVGVSPVRIAALVAVHLVVVFSLMQLLPKLFKKKVQQG
ncbi:unannotated protein [freshwater metagenome]|uniref:Unannotated protein n=1 Tax=freshwater metagenome TaxID=449393 RepID=A0A6J7G6N4_9ZZZZ|nr:hypothetical protein [Actinomycetota bacterium]